MSVIRRKEVVRQINAILPGCTAHQEIVVKLDVGTDSQGRPVEMILCRILKNENLLKSCPGDGDPGQYVVTHSWEAFGCGGVSKAVSSEQALRLVEGLRTSLLNQIKQDPAKVGVQRMSIAYA